jgi:hypothetical protein
MVAYILKNPKAKNPEYIEILDRALFKLNENFTKTTSENMELFTFVI